MFRRKYPVPQEENTQIRKADAMRTMYFFASVSQDLLLQVSTSAAPGATVVPNVLITVVLLTLLYVLVLYGLRSLLRRFSLDIGSVALRISQVPVIIVAVFSVVKSLLTGFDVVPAIVWMQCELTALDNLKTTRNEWQEPKIWLSEVMERMNS